MFHYDTLYARAGTGQQSVMKFQRVICLVPFLARFSPSNLLSVRNRPSPATADGGGTPTGAGVMCA